MALTPSELIIGPARVEFGGADLGFTSEDGITLSPEFEHVEFMGGQAIGISAVSRSKAVLRITCAIHQLTNETLEKLLDTDTAATSSAVTFDFSHNLTERALALTMPGPNGTTNVFTGTAVCRPTGGAQFSPANFTGMEVEFTLIMNPTTGSYGSIAQTAGSVVAPTIGSYDTVDDADSETTLTDADTGVAVDEAIQVVFSKQIRPDMLTGNYFMLTADDGNTVVAGTIAYGVTASATDRTKVKITPTSDLSTSTKYWFTVAEGVRDMDGLGLAATAHIQFTTTS